MADRQTKTETITRETGIIDPNIKIAVMNNDIQHINDTLTRIEAKFDGVINSFVTHEKLDDATKAAEEKHNNIIASFEAKAKEQDRAIVKLEDWNMWAVRIVLGAIILAGVSALLITKPF